MPDRDLTPTASASAQVACGWWVGPVWKLDAETCVCIEPTGHEMPHKCSCGAWFENCGHPPKETHGD